MDRIISFKKHLKGVFDSKYTHISSTGTSEPIYEKLVAQEEAELAETSERGGRNGRIMPCKNIFFLAANILFLTLNAGLYVRSTRSICDKPQHLHTGEIESVDFVPSPMQHTFGHEITRTDIGIGQTSIYGEDSLEADQEWIKISQDGPLGWIQVQKDDLDRINQTSVKLADGSGYIAGVEVFHELHCLNWFRRKVLGRNFDPKEDPMPEYHLPHCLDILRHSIQCHADLSIMPLRWVEDYPFPWPVFQTTRQCRNWDDIMQWTRENSIAASGRVEHPKMGPIDALDWDPEQLPRVGHLRYIDEY